MHLRLGFFLALILVSSSLAGDLPMATTASIDDAIADLFQSQQAAGCLA